MSAQGARSAMVVFLCAVSLSGGQAALPEGPGRTILQSACASCHSLDVVTEKRWSNQRWRDSVNAMIARSAASNKDARLSKDQAAELVSYLAANFGNQERAKGLFEDICSSCHALERVAKRSLSRDEWGTFIKGMISEGNPVNDEEFAILQDYLAEHYGNKETNQ